jgi:phage recombination protein Bet
MPKEITTTASTANITTLTPINQLIDTYLSSVKTASGLPPTEVDKVNFITFCLVNNLNPIKKQAYLLGYDKKKDFIVSISGYISIAMQTGLFAGIARPHFAYVNNNLDSCSISVYRIVKGEKCEFVGTAYYSERVQLTDEYSAGRKTGKMKPNDAWAKQPKTMLEKCAKAAALRNAFPDQLSGVYTEDEMPKADVEIEAKKPEVVPEIEYITDPQLQLLLKGLIPDRATKAGKHAKDVVQGICETYKVQGLHEMTKKEAIHIIGILKQVNDQVPPPEDLVEVESQSVNDDEGVESSFVEVEVTDTPAIKSERQSTIEECTSLEILQSLEEGITTEEEKLAFDIRFQEFNK